MGWLVLRLVVVMVTLGVAAPLSPDLVPSRAPATPSVSLRCAYKSAVVSLGDKTDRRPASNDSAEDHGEIIVEEDGNEVEVCLRASRHCYALWEKAPTLALPAGDDNSDGDAPSPVPAMLIIRQGCWESPGRADCERSACVADRHLTHKRLTKRFCCCRGARCNVNVSDSGAHSSAPRNAAADAGAHAEADVHESGVELDAARAARELDRGQRAERARAERRLVAVLSGVTLLVAVLVAATALHAWRGASVCACLSRAVGGGAKAEPDAVRLVDGYVTYPSYASDHLQLACLVGQGRYGTVWRGSFQERDVAVKMFPAHHRQYFLNERDIYCLPFMDCPALLSYLGCEERPIDGSMQYLLILSYAPNGCLQDYLRTHTLDCVTFCRMAQGVAQGLAHLHTDVHKGDKVKPCVSHRDLNTRNILVTADHGTVICDLGLAMKLQGSKYFCNGETQHAETKSINDVGTLRYMAPEVLEGAVNLRDCESSLKQIDVYALGLVLWELATRCADLYQPHTQVPAYKLPFEAEVGHHPTFEQMQGLVSRHKARPLFPELWLDWSGIRLLKETIEDCWDQDAEARLTALCVQERLSELPGLWERQKATVYVSGVSPTVNPTFPVNVGSCPFVQTNTASCQSHRLSSTNNNVNYCASSGAAVFGSECNSQECSRPLLMEQSEGQGYSSRSLSQMSSSCGKEKRESTASEGTVDTMVTLSPESHPMDTNKNSNMANGSVSSGGFAFGVSNGEFQQPSLTQPACFPSILPCGGPLQAFQGRNPCMERNLMVAAGSKEGPSCRGNAFVDRSLKHVYEGQALVSHDFLAAAMAASISATCPQSQSTASFPNSSVNCGGPRPVTPIPYVQNAVYDLHSSRPKQPNIPGNGSSDAEGSCEQRRSRWPSWSGLKRLLASKRQQLFGHEWSRTGVSALPVASPPSYYPKEPDRDVKSNLLIHENGIGVVAEPIRKLPKIVDTQVCLLPPSKTASGKSSGGVFTSVTTQNNEESLSSTPMPQEGSEGMSARQQCRPSTLPLVPMKTQTDFEGRSIDEQFQNIFGSNSESKTTRRLKDPSLHVKTPGDVPPSVRRLRSRGAKGAITARFSLYDDRVMSGENHNALDAELRRSDPDVSSNTDKISSQHPQAQAIFKSNSPELCVNSTSSV